MYLYTETDIDQYFLIGCEVVSVWFGKFKLPEIEQLKFKAPSEAETIHIRNSGLEPTEWLVPESPTGFPFMLLRKRGGDSIAVLANIERSEQ